MSVDRPQDILHFGMLKHILPQQVIMPGTHLGKVLPLAERQMAIGKQTSRYPEGLSRRNSRGTRLPIRHFLARPAGQPRLGGRIMDRKRRARLVCRNLPGGQRNAGDAFVG